VVALKRTSDELHRDAAALIKQSEDLATDAKELARTAADLLRKADTIKAALENQQRTRDVDRKRARKGTAD
jgi:hypothetical protein